MIKFTKNTYKDIPMRVLNNRLPRIIVLIIVFFNIGLPINTSASTVSEITLSAEYAAQSELRVSYSIQNANELSAYGLELYYDPDYLEVESVDNGDFALAGMLTSNTKSSGCIVVSYITTDSLNGTGELLIVNYRIKKEGTVSFDVKVTEAINSELQSIDVNCSSFETELKNSYDTEKPEETLNVLPTQKVKTASEETYEVIGECTDSKIISQVEGFYSYSVKVYEIRSQSNKFYDDKEDIAAVFALDSSGQLQKISPVLDEDIGVQYSLDDQYSKVYIVKSSNFESTADQISENHISTNDSNKSISNNSKAILIIVAFIALTIVLVVIIIVKKKKDGKRHEKG